ncbi:MAG: hypothetical protein WBG08_08385 [Litorimonas sp.]
MVWLIALLGGGLILGMLAIKVWFTASVFSPIDPALVEAYEASARQMDEPLDAREQMALDMVTPAAPGTPVMPDANVAFDPSAYSETLAVGPALETGMDRYAATDALLLHYNDQAEGETRAKVSSSERRVDGATLFVIRRSGLADDSIAAEETYALFDAETLVAFGSRQQCRRGDTPNSWTTELCP